MDKLWYIQTIKCNSAIKRNELSSCEKTGGNLKYLLLSARSQYEKATCSTIPTTWHLERANYGGIKWPAAARGWGRGRRKYTGHRGPSEQRDYSVRHWGHNTALLFNMKSQHSSHRSECSSAGSGFSQQETAERLVGHRHHNSQVHSHTHLQRTFNTMG